MEEYSQAVLEERDLINEQLQLKEAEIEQERILRIELNDRLQELQKKVKKYAVISHIIIIIIIIMIIISIIIIIIIIFIIIITIIIIFYFYYYYFCDIVLINWQLPNS